MPADPNTVRMWLISLAAVCVPLSKPELEERIKPMASMLAHDYPEQWFTADSLRFVASKVEHFPVYSLIRAHLDQWVRELGLDRRLPEMPPPGELDAIGRAWVRRWQAAAAASFVDASGRQPVVVRENLLSLIRVRQPEAYAQIMGPLEELPGKKPVQAEVDAIADKLRAHRLYRASAPAPAPAPEPPRRAYQPKPIKPEVLAEMRKAAGSPLK